MDDLPEAIFDDEPLERKKNQHEEIFDDEPLERKRRRVRK